MRAAAATWRGGACAAHQLREQAPTPGRSRPRKDTCRRSSAEGTARGRPQVRAPSRVRAGLRMHLPVFQLGQMRPLVSVAELLAWREQARWHHCGDQHHAPHCHRLALLHSQALHGRARIQRRRRPPRPRQGLHQAPFIQRRSTPMRELRRPRLRVLEVPLVQGHRSLRLRAECLHRGIDQHCGLMPAMPPRRSKGVTNVTAKNAAAPA